MCSSIIDSDVLVEYAGGKMYVTIGVGLMSNISDMSVQVQSGGSYSTAALTMTGSCTRDGDVCNHYRFEMPSKDSYIRMKMYVVPMGRAVTFYVKLDMSTARSGTGNFVSEMVSVPQAADTSNTDTQESVVITAIENTENVEREENEDENEEMTDAEEATEYESTEETTAFSENMSSEVISADTSNQYLSGVTGLSLHFVNETSQNDDTDSNYTALAVFAVIIVAVGAFYIVKRQRGRKDV
jgi:hypothetical protein